MEKIINDNKWIPKYGANKKENDPSQCTNEHKWSAKYFYFICRLEVIKQKSKVQEI